MAQPLEHELPTQEPTPELSGEQQVAEFTEMATALFEAAGVEAHTSLRIPGIVKVTARVLDLEDGWRLIEINKSILGKPKPTTYSVRDTVGKQAPDRYEWVAGTPRVRQRSLMHSEGEGTRWEWTRLPSWGPEKIKGILSSED